MRRMRRLVLAVLLACAGASPAFAEPPTTHEVLTQRPSGFWTSNQRAEEGHEYRYRLMLVGIAVVGIMGLVTWRVLRNARGPTRP